MLLFPQPGKPMAQKAAQNTEFEMESLKKHERNGAALVFAGRKKRGEHAEVGVGKQQAFRLAARGTRGANDRTEVFAAGHGVKVFRADSRKARNLVFGKCLLGGLDRDHFPAILCESCDRLNK